MMKLGFVGMGLIGARRIKIAQSLGFPIAFAVDPDAKRREAFALEGSCVAASLEEIEAQGAGNADAVLIAVPHDLALKTCLWAFDKGAHVLCEKPMGLTLEQGELIAAAAEKAGRHFCAGFNYRYLPGVAALREVIQAGKLGEIIRVRLAMGHGGRPGMETEWKLKQARAGGGALIDPGIHLIDLALHLFGEQTLSNVWLRRRFWNSDVEDNCALALNSSAGADIAIEVSLTSWRNQFTIEAYGADGMAVLNGRGANYGTQHLEYVNRWFWQGTDNRFSKDLGVADPSFELETKAFLDLIANGKSDGVLSDAKAGCAALTVVQRAYDQTPSFS